MHTMLQIGGLGDRLETLTFYITTAFSENVLSDPQVPYRAHHHFTHLVLSLEIRSVKCHGVFNVACLQIVLMSPLLRRSMYTVSAQPALQVPQSLRT